MIKIAANLFLFSSAKTATIFGNGSSILSVSHLWNGIGNRPNDYYVNDKLQIQGEWKLQDGIFRVLYSTTLSDPSMAININHLRKSKTLNQLIQLSANEKEQLVANPSTVIIKPNLSHEPCEREDQIARNVQQLQKLFQSAVGLKTSYLIDSTSLFNKDYMQQIKHLNKAVSADIVSIGAKLEDVVFDHGYKLEHVFLDGTSTKPSQSTLFRYDYNLKNVLLALAEINFKGKLVLPQGQKGNAMLEVLHIAAKEVGYSHKLQYDLQTDGWYTML